MSALQVRVGAAHDKDAAPVPEVLEDGLAGEREIKMKSFTETMNRHENDTPIRKVEGVLLSRGKTYWQTERLPIHGCRIVDNTGRLIAADVYDEEIAEQIVREHNECNQRRLVSNQPDSREG